MFRISFDTGVHRALIDLVHVKVLSFCLLSFHLECSNLSHGFLRLLVELSHIAPPVDLDKSTLILHLLHVELFLGYDGLDNAPPRSFS